MVTGFARRLRILHPVPSGPVAGPASWREVAALVGIGLTADTTWDDFLVNADGLPAHLKYGDWGSRPSLGTLPRDHAATLADALSKCTSTPEDCFFAVWAGWASLAPRWQKALRCDLPNRETLLLAGRIEDAAVNLAEALAGNDSEFKAANLWWPADHAWLVATDVDDHSTDIGCDEVTRQAILARARAGDFEALDLD